MMFQRKVVSNKRERYGMLNRIFNGCLGAFLMAGCLALTAQEVTDSGVQAVQEAQESNEPEASTQISAVEELNRICMERGWDTQWDGEKKRRFIIADADFKSENPAKDEHFFENREDAVRKAILKAKAEFIETINTRLSAEDSLEIPGTDVEKELRPELVALNKEIASVANQIAEATKESDEVLYNEALTLAATGAAKCLDSILKRLGEEGTLATGVANAADKLEEAKIKLKELKQKQADLVAKAEAFKGTVVEKQTSFIETAAKMPLYGATIVSQRESWDPDSGLYQVAVLLCWSIELERSARACLTGVELKVEPSDRAVAIKTWLSKQKNLASWVGARHYLDDEGNRWFLGISARPYSNYMRSSLRSKMQGLAQKNAYGLAAFCLLGDMESHSMARRESETRVVNDQDVKKVVESFMQKLKMSIEGRNIRGVQKIHERSNIKHPITGQSIYVVVYGITADSAKDALEIEKLNVATAIQANRHQTVERGREEANAAAIEASKNRQEDYDKGYNERTGKINQELNKRESQQKPIRRMQDNAPAATKKPAQSRGGVFGGEDDLDDIF